MKRILSPLLVTLLTAISVNALGQTSPVPKTEQEVRDLLCHKWQPVSMKENGVILPIEKEDSALYIILFRDGTFVDYFEGNSPSNKWTYNHKTKTITMAHELKIVRIDNKELILTSKTEGVLTTLTLKRVD